MALKIPFERDGFSSDFKSKLSGANVNLEFDNIESTLLKTGLDIAKLIGRTLYGKLCDANAATGTGAAELNSTSKDYLQRALIHFSVYHHIIFLIARIGNDGVTVKKNEDETTIFKYQSDELKNKLISDAWFWMNELIAYLNENEDNFTDWKASDAQKAVQAVPVTVDDFAKWIGVSDVYFVLCASGIIREVWMDCVLSRKKEATKTDAIARAVCYEVVARACTRLSYYSLPEPIRTDINSEMTKDHASQEDGYIRDKIAKQYAAQAEAYWRTLDQQLYQAQQSEIETNVSKQMYVPASIAETDRFCC